MSAALDIKAEFQEEQHPRDQLGRFSESGIRPAEDDDLAMAMALMELDSSPALTEVGLALTEQDGDNVILVKEERGQLMGAINYLAGADAFEVRHVGSLRKGAGGALVREVENRAKVAGADWIYLTAAPEAEGFWEKMGYARVHGGIYSKPMREGLKSWDEDKHPRNVTVVNRGGAKSLKAADDTELERWEEFLARADESGLMTPEQEERLRERWEAGEVDGTQIPVPLDEAIIRPRRSDLTAAVLALGLALLASALGRRARRRDELQTRFESRVIDLAKTAETLEDWQREFRSELTQYIVQQAVLGRGAPEALDTADELVNHLTAEYSEDLEQRIAFHLGQIHEQHELEDAARLARIAENAESAEISSNSIIGSALDSAEVQQAYLSRFADQRAVRELTDELMSWQYIAARSALYSGQGRAEWFRGSEDSLDAGWVVYYRAIGDSSTCRPCKEAEKYSPYLPGRGPYPGEVCDGHGYCRCEREPVYDAELYALLGGQ